MKPSAFFGSVDDAAWDPYRDLLEDDGTFVLNIGAWLVHTEGRTILVDTGIVRPPGADAVPGAASAALGDGGGWRRY